MKQYFPTLLLGFVLIAGCTHAPIERKEVAPYTERVMRELSDSCRLISITGLHGKKCYQLECPDNAREITGYFMKK